MIKENDEYAYVFKKYENRVAQDCFFKVLVNGKETIVTYSVSYPIFEKCKISPYAKEFAKAVFANAKKVEPYLITQEIVSVQPMALPSGLLFGFDDVSEKKEVKND